MACITKASLPRRSVRTGAGFIDEFRSQFRRSHTPREIPGEGTRRGLSLDAWTITPRSAITYLEQTRHVHTALRMGLDCPVHVYDAFRHYDVDRTEELTQDLYRLRLCVDESDAHDADPNSPGVTYATLLNECAFLDPVTFLCHMYGVVFAHESGGPMIAKRIVTDLALPHPLLAYEPPTYDPNALRATFFKWAETLTPDDRARALFEAERAFERVWSVLRVLDDPDIPASSKARSA